MVELLLQLISLLWLMETLVAADPPNLAKPGCLPRCGNVRIPYPFGVGENCYHDHWYQITCKESFGATPTPFLRKLNLEVLNISLRYQNLTVNSPIEPACIDSSFTSADLRGSPFYFSTLNKFTVIGCGNALLRQGGKILGGCTSMCGLPIDTKACYGINCCETSIPPGLDIFNVTITAGNCTHAFLLRPGYFPDKPATSFKVREMKHAPLEMRWTITNKHLPPEPRRPPYDYYCYDREIIQGERNSYCECGSTYEGNPYIPHGCKVVKECTGCMGRCVANYLGNNTYEYYCDNRKSSKAVILGVSISGGLMFLLVGGFWLYKGIRKIRNIRLRNKFFKRNGGLLLQQQMLSNEGVVDKVFTSNELEKATDNFNKNRILGQGGQGTVYKGMLTDGRIIAIKKSKLVDENQLEQFINEVVILSQINHRNVVKLLGCCLETDVPLLVYEFIPNGTLFQLIHDQNEDFPLSWERRLQIATEVAGAIAYLHSASSVPIYHRDIKSTNILLDDKYRAKVSDFGTSRSIAIEQTHLTTLVHGTFGYLDPEYFQSSQFTDKSDVYSFGVVLVELLTGQKPISSTRSQEEKSLAKHFILSLKETRLFDILDAQVMKEGGKEEIMEVANLAKRCLNLNGKKRPTMKEVTMELEGIRMSHMPLIGQQNFKEDECNIVKSDMPLITQQNFQEDECIVELAGPLDGASTSTSSSLAYTRGIPSDVHPLLHNIV